MKKRGFTLIELLAVIVILAIIALIATPIIMNTISNSKKAAAERSAERYASAVETMIATERLDNEVIADGTYSINSSGNLVVNGVEKPIDMTGTKPNGGSITIKDGAVVKSSTTTIAVGEYIVSYDANSKIVSTKNEATGALCKATTPSVQNLFDANAWAMGTTTAGVQATEDSRYALGAEYLCDLGDGERTFYVLKEGKEDVKLIMNENIGEYVAWSGVDDNTVGAIVATDELLRLTSEWKELESVGGTVDLPDASDLAAAMGDSDWSADGSATGKACPTWMLVNFDGENGLYAYWTKTPSQSYNTAWYVDFNGTMEETGHFVKDAEAGIRPVITIPKENMSL